MPRPYMPPMDRAGMRETAPEPEAPVTESAEPAEAGEATSVFIPADALGGMAVKAGDTLTLTVRAVDEETGEVEAVPAEAPETESKPGYEAAMDEQIPED